MRIINLTSHSVNLHTDLGQPGMHSILVIQPSGDTIRARQSTKIIEKILVEDKVVHITSTTYKGTVKLPPEQDDVYYIVSSIVAKQYKGIRNDLVIPNGLVRDNKGVVIGCKSLGKV